MNAAARTSHFRRCETNGNPSTIRGDQRIITTGPGSNKQLSIQGLVWAPYAALEFDLISNDAVAALTGGAVVSELSAGASANANNFLIRVATTPANKVLNLTTTADSPDNQGSTSVRSVVTVQRSNGATAFAVDSRRVVGLTPEGPAAPPPPPPPPPPPGPGPGPSPTTGPCNETTTTWTNDFGDGDWTVEYWNLASFSTETPPGDPFSGTVVHTEQLSEINRYLDGASPEPGVVNSDYYAARFTRTIDVGAACSVTIRAGSDDGVRVRIDGDHRDQWLGPARSYDHDGGHAHADGWHAHDRRRLLRTNGRVLARTRVDVLIDSTRAGSIHA